MYLYSLPHTAFTDYPEISLATTCVMGGSTVPKHQWWWTILHVTFQYYYVYFICTKSLGQDVKSWVKIIQGCAKFEFKYESLKSKFRLIHFVLNLMNGCSKKNREIIQENNLEQKKKKPGLTFNPGLAIISFWTTRPALTVKLYFFFSSEISPKLFHVSAIFFFPEKELELSTPLMERLLFINQVNNRSFNQCSILDKMFHRWTINSMGKKRVKSCKGNINQCLRFNFR